MTSLALEPLAAVVASEQAEIHYPTGKANLSVL